MQAGRRGSLLAQPTPLIGREKLVAFLTERLSHPDVRLLTLTGAGGSGKTRLALEVGAKVKEGFSDGVFLVDLAPLAGPTLVLSAVASPVGVRDIGGQPLVETLGQYLEDRRVLLLLDNFEHLLAAADQVAELLAACPKLKVLVTSRAPLRLRWEHEVPVSPLAVPDLQMSSSPAALVEVPSVKLFVARAKAVRPTFELTPNNAAAVAELCVRMDGLPLALELAAAGTKLLSPTTILGRLRRRMGLVASPRRDQPARHETLEAAIGWSYDLLPQAGQALFRRLAVFSGGWSLEAAEAVCTGAGIDSSAVLESLVQLMDHSLVLSEDGPGGELRYRVLETIREFARERLEDSGERADIQRRHAAYMLVLAEQLGAELRGPNQVMALDQLELEHDNLRTALRWAVDGSIAETSLRLVAALWEFWWIRGHLTQGQEWLEAALATNGGVTSARAWALNGAGLLAAMQGDLDRGSRYLAQSAAVFRELDESHGLVRVLCHQGFGAALMGAWEQATSQLEEGLAIARAGRNRWATGYALFTLAQVAQMQGEDQRAARFLEESLILFGEVADRRGMAYAQVFLAEIARAAGAGERFEVLSRDALSHFGELRDAWGVLLALVSLALAAVMNDEPTSAARLFGAADAVARATGASDPVLFPQNWGRNKQALHEASLIARAALGDTAYDAAWSIGRGQSLEEAVIEALSLGRPAGCRPTGEHTTPGATREFADQAHEDAKCARLTRREQEIAALIARGQTSREIARLLMISERTADAHAEHIRDKLGLRSRTEIAAWAVKRGLLDAPFSARGPQTS